MSGPIFAIHRITMRTPHFLLAAAFLACSTVVSAQSTIYSYAIGNWRNGPVVEISPLFETTEAYTTPQLIAWVRKEWPEQFRDTTDIDVQRFATLEEGSESRTTLKAKYGMRHLEVDMMERDPMPSTPPSPAEGNRKTPATAAPR